MKRVTIFCQLLFMSFLLIVRTEARANPIVVAMIKAEKTGNKTQIPPPVQGGERQPLPWYYEIKVEWKITGTRDPNKTSNLYRRNRPEAYPNGNIIAHDVSKYAEEGFTDDLCKCVVYRLYYRHDDWVPEGTWYYMAEQSVDEVYVTVP